MRSDPRKEGILSGESDSLLVVQRFLVVRFSPLRPRAPFLVRGGGRGIESVERDLKVRGTGPLVPVPDAPSPPSPPRSHRRRCTPSRSTPRTRRYMELKHLRVGNPLGLVEKSDEVRGVESRRCELLDPFPSTQWWGRRSGDEGW